MNDKIDEFIVIMILVLILAPISVIVEIITLPSKNRVFFQMKTGRKLARLINA